MTDWLLADHVFAELQALRHDARNGHAPQAFAETERARRVGGVLEIPVLGLLVKHRDPFVALFAGGYTPYSSIIASLEHAQNDASIERVELLVDSPGGSADGLFDTLAALENFTKPMTARCTQACSAAYAIAATANRIEATNRASAFGSLGVAATFFVDARIVDVSSSEAPEKRPDVTTPEGKASVRRYLDALHTLLVEAIARGRKTTVERVNGDFGRGAIVLAREAKQAGMIDTITKWRTNSARAPESRAPEGVTSMTTQTQAAHDFIARFSRARDECRRPGPDLIARMAARFDPQPAAPARVTPDMGDRVAAKMLIERGKPLPADLASRFGQVAPDARGPEEDEEDEEDEDDEPPPSAARGDMGDRVVARMKAERGRR